MALFSLITAFVAGSLAQTAADLTNSINIPSSDINSQIISSGTPGMYDVLSDLGVILPEEGADFAILHTGRVGASPESGVDNGAYGANGDEAALTIQLTAPSDANSFVFEFYFLSAEYPEWVGSMYNDAFETWITGSAWTGNAAIDETGSIISINSALFDVTSPSELNGTGFANVGGGTGWQMTTVPVDPGDTLTVEFVIYDVSDGNYDSAVLLDNFYWSEADVDEPSIGEPLIMEYLSPKRGSILGGETTSIYGQGFEAGCTSSFDGAFAPTSFVSSGELTATPAAHDAGLVDVEVECDGSTTYLVGGYTYYDTESGSVPPLIDSLDPYRVELEGGELVTMTGEDFVDGAVVSVDGIAVATTYLDANTLQFTTPPHDAGLVDVGVANPDGLADLRSGGLLFFTEAAGSLLDTGSDDTGVAKGSDSDCGCSATTTPRAAWALLLPLLGVLTRRRA